MSPIGVPWSFVSGQKKHTQDGCQLAALMKSVGHGRRPVEALDVGCGDGIIAYEMFRLNKATRVVAFDILKEAAEAAEINLSAFIDSNEAEVFRSTAKKFFAQKNNYERFDRFVINPPFFISGSGEVNKRSKDQVARHDQNLPLKVWAKGAKRCLKEKGELYCVFPTERLAECVVELSNQGIRPKEIWWLKADKRKRRFFLRAVRGAKPGLQIHFDHII